MKLKPMNLNDLLSDAKIENGRLSINLAALGVKVDTPPVQVVWCIMNTLLRNYSLLGTKPDAFTVTFQHTTPRQPVRGVNTVPSYVNPTAQTYTLTFNGTYDIQQFKLTDDK